jgi:Zn-dependent protease with chaperone function
MTAPITLVALAVLLATAGRAALLRTAWLDRSPRLGIVAWQSLSASALVAVVLAGAALALPAVPLSTDVAVLVSACASALRQQYSTPAGAAASGAGALVAVAVLARTGYCLVTALVVSSRERWRQLHSLDLTARRHAASGALVVEHSAPAAYCLPGRRREVVLTTAALSALRDDELAAVLAHEEAHLRGRHHLVLAAAAALRRAFPGVPLFRDAQAELIRLVEMAADDAATRRHERLSVATALVRLAEASAPAAALGAGGSTSLLRVQRLAAPAQPLGRARSALALAGAAAVLALPVVVATAPAIVAATADLCPVSFPEQPLV